MLCQKKIKFKLIYTIMKKTLLLVLALLFSQSLFPALARIEVLEHTERLPQVASQSREELQMLATLRARHSLLRKLSGHLSGWSEFQKIEKARLESLAAQLFTVDTLNLSPPNSSEVTIKTKVTVDSLLIPEDLTLYLHEQHFSLLNLQKHLNYTWHLEEELALYLNLLASTPNPQTAELHRMQTGAPLKQRYAAMEMFYQGTEAMRLRRQRESEELFSAALKLDPQYELAYFMRGMTHLRSQKYDLALADFETGLKLNPTDQSFLFGRALAYTRQGLFPTRALADLNHLIKLNPNRSRLYDLRAENQFLLNNCYRAREDYAQACNLGYRQACTAECRQNLRSDQLR